MSGGEPTRSTRAPSGDDEEDPYDGDDLSDYPGWWRRNIEEFRAHDLGPYRSPRFADGEVVPERRAILESKLGIDIRIRAHDPAPDDEWVVLVDGERTATVERRREPEGYTRYGITSDEFETIVRTTTDE